MLKVYPILIGAIAIIVLFNGKVAFAHDEADEHQSVEILGRSPWERIKKPIPGSPTVFGSYANGCIVGAEQLIPSSAIWEFVNTSRNRHYGHTQLRSFLEKLGTFTVGKKFGKLIIGDTSLPAGGKTDYGHASHQLGIEADIRFEFFNGTRMDEAQRNSWAFHDIAEFVKAKRKVKGRTKTVTVSRLIPNTWNEGIYQALKFSASDALVDRMFVAPAIKHKMCQEAKLKEGSYPEWLKKIRPWTGHTAHFHVRMKCPATSPDCEPQSPIPQDSTDSTKVGCAGEHLMSWLEAEPVKKSSLESIEESEQKSEQPQILLRSQCREILRNI